MSRRLSLSVASLLLTLTACQGVGPEPASEEEQSATAAVNAPIAAGDYVIHTVTSGKCLDVSGASSADGASVQEWSCNGTVAQVFHVIPVGDGYYEIVNIKSNKALDIRDVSFEPNARLQQWGYGGGKNQQFKIVDRGNGEYSLHPRHTDLALDVFWGNPADGTPIVQYFWTGNANQRWTFTAVGGSGEKSGGNPDPKAALPTRLRITNQCADPLWVAHSENLADAQNVKLGHGQSRDYAIPDAGLAALRVWPKVGCDESGHDCRIGDSVAPCPKGGCQPPVDSKFEASFASKGGSSRTWYNLSQVDGYTLPFKVVPRGPGAEDGSCVTSDCSNLSLDACPGDEDMSGGGKFPAFAHEDLRIRDGQGTVIGCLSPCKKWNYPSPWGLGQSEGADPGLHLCCPTPINPASGQCTTNNACMTSEACRNTADPVSVEHTHYVSAMRAMCPTAYSYSYDDAAGLHNCSAETGFEVVFCP